MARSVEAVGDWWALLIVRDAFTGKRRFGEFEKSLGVAKNILTVRLKKLVADGVLELVPASDGSAFKEYALTGRGLGLLPVIAVAASIGLASPARSQQLDRTASLLQALTEAPGPSAFEEAIREVVVREFRALGAQITYDGLGSVLATLPGAAEGRGTRIGGSVDGAVGEWLERNLRGSGANERD